MGAGLQGKSRGPAGRVFADSTTSGLCPSSTPLITCIALRRADMANSIGNSEWMKITSTYYNVNNGKPISADVKLSGSVGVSSSQNACWMVRVLPCLHCMTSLAWLAT